MSEEIERAAALAGFKRMPLDSSRRSVFVRGSVALIVHSYGKWTSYGELSGGKPEYYGDDFASSGIFLQNVTEDQDKP